MEIVTTAVVLFLIMDPLGNVPLFLAVLKDVPSERQLKITLRELLIAYAVLLLYLFGGVYILEFLSLSQEAISISGGIILFLIAIRMIFPTPQGLFGDSTEGEPLIVPLAIPAVAGPSCLAVLMLLTTSQSSLNLFIAVSIAWVGVAIILLASTPLHRFLGKRGLIAVERLMGMLLVMMSVQMMLNALETLKI